MKSPNIHRVFMGILTLHNFILLYINKYVHLIFMKIAQIKKKWEKTNKTKKLEKQSGPQHVHPYSRLTECDLSRKVPW